MYPVNRNMHCGKPRVCRQNACKRGNVPHNRGTKCDFSPDKVDVKYSRLTLDVFSYVVSTSLGDGCFHTLDVHGHPTSTHMLRPSANHDRLTDMYLDEQMNKELSTYKLLQPQRTANLFNTSYKAHRYLKPYCYGALEFDESRSKQWDL